MEDNHIKLITILTLILSVTLSVVSYHGAFIKSTYERDALSMAVQGMGQDIFDLFFVVPLLLILLLLMHKGNRLSFLIFGGTVFYVLYSFFIYSFGVHFNKLFLLYCIILSSSLYTFILLVIQLNGMKVYEWFDDRVPVRTVGIYFIVIAIMFYVLWLKDIIPAIINNSTPESVSDYNLLVNPVHVLDIAIILPGLIITAVLLMRRKQAGFIFAPIFLVFVILLAIALIAMVIMLQIKGISEDLSIAGIFAIIALISVIFSIIFFKTMKPQQKISRG